MANWPKKDGNMSFDKQFMFIFGVLKSCKGQFIVHRCMHTYEIKGKR